MKCFKCRGECEDGINFCPHCGIQLYFSEELISRAQQNDQQAISRLYEMTYNSVYNTIRVMVSDEDTVYDLLQDTYLKAFGHLDQLSSPQTFRGWLRRIARNLTVDYLRKKKPMLFSSMTAEGSDEEIDFPDERVAAMPEEVIDRQETKLLLDEIMNSLPEDQRAVITLYYYEEIPVKEIAAMLGISENTVKSRLSYGRKKIELGVKELEKKGTKLYSLSPIPFLLFLLRSMDAQAAEIPNPHILQNVLLGESAFAAKASGKTPQSGGSVIKAGMEGGAAVAKKAAATKIITAITAVAVIGGCVAGGVYFVHNRNANEEAQTTQYEADSSPTSERPEVPADTEEPAPETDISEAEVAEQAYQEILDEYRALSELDSADFEANKDAYLAQYPYPNEMMMADYLAHYGDMYLYYVFEDINHDGTAELIVAFRVPTDTGFLPAATNYIPTDLYFFDGEKAVQGIGHHILLYPDTMIGFYEDGTIEHVFIEPETYDQKYEYLRLNDAGTALEAAERPEGVGVRRFESYDWQLLAEPEK